MNLVFLPATEPDDETYGTVPERIEAHPGAVVHQVRFPAMVWYNESVRREAVEQIRALDADPIVLVGFSKSGHGAWHIAQALPERVAATIIFDSPVVRDELPPWGTEPFYPDDAAWQVDQPIRTIGAFKAAVPERHVLVLVSGEAFHAEMLQLSQALAAADCGRVFLSRPDLKHHWASGWIEAGLDALQAAWAERSP